MRLIPWLHVAMIKAIKEEYHNFQLIQHITCPVMVMHGRKDGIIPFHVGHALYEAGRLARSAWGDPSSGLWFVDFPGAGHNDVYAQPSWVRQIKSFMMMIETKSSLRSQPLT